ncbi:MAG TPA: c-type cytochrome [Geminicoccus sp.]|jgi:cytochrome c553|uniref:c-type cytochrome n=1 Tax=Geminicoccus sp. TaxID=2024832 RepID=UPI002E2EFF5F|nr:c-type cytochrome [Geminicoccus sp.]HEX2529107.1 c-type cytochrome [Geminicoccus sp.]
MIIRLRYVLWAGLAAAILAFLVGWSGIVGIRASSGHWLITDVVLHWAMQNSVRTDALDVTAPPNLDDPALVRRAAGHFETSCAFCHRSPARQERALPRRMTPPPPLLTHAARDWTPEQLFVIVQHGVKFSGMPAWISLDRADEVWAMVAFLRQLPEMDAATYEQLAFGEALNGQGRPEDPVLDGCMRCHGSDGDSDGGAFPVLASQREDYLVRTLQAFSEGRRASGIMQYATAGLSPEDLARAAHHYAGQPPPSPSKGQESAEAVELGRAIATNGIPEEGVPACQFCHRTEPVRNPIFPLLEGQEKWYLATQLRLWKDGVRGGTNYQEIMRQVARHLSDEEIDALAAFYSSEDRAPALTSAEP